MMRGGEMQCIEEFISIYRKETCLWQVKDKDYRNRNKKEVAYTRLLEKLKEIDPYATKECVLKKIGNLRTSFRKEFKKVLASKQTGNSPHEVYTPKLWYYKLFYFLNEDIQNSEDSIHSDDEVITWSEEDTARRKRIKVDNGSDNSTEVEFFTTEKHSPAEISFRQRSPSKVPDPLTDEPLIQVEERFQQPRTEDRFDIYGKIVVMKMRDLPKMQMILAEKLINDILFEAEMGNLTTSHRMCQTQPDCNLFGGVIDSSSSRFSQPDYNLNNSKNQ